MFFYSPLFFYPILNVEKYTEIEKLYKPIETFKKLGLDFYQLRAKNLDEESYYQLATQLKNKYKRQHILANDFVSLAVENLNTFSGLHLGQDDWKNLSNQNKEKIYKIRKDRKDFVLGLSTHSALEIQAINFPWTYIALGPCFSTNSKIKDILEGLEKKKLEDALRMFSKQEYIQKRNIALVLIGGISSINIKKLLEIVKKYIQSQVSKEKYISIASIKGARDQSEIKKIISQCQCVLSKFYS